MSKTTGQLVTLVLALCCFLIAPVKALELLPNAPKEYRVQEGDTLWNIAGRYTSSPWQWQDIWHKNPQITNPDLIFPGDLIGLVQVNGETKVGVLERGLASRTVKLSPGDTVKLLPAVRIEPIESAIPAIPVSTIAGFLNENRVAEYEELKDAPHVIGGEAEHLVMGANSQLYARGEFGSNVGAVYGVYRRGKAYKDPDSGEMLGFEAIHLGFARVAALQGDIATLELERVTSHILVGDLLLPTEDRQVVTRFYPTVPDHKVSGRILSVSGGVSQVGQFDVVVLNQGERDNVSIGDVFVINKEGAIVFDRVNQEKVRLPGERAGTLMVFRVYEKLSYALIMRATHPLRVGDRFTTP